MLLNVPTSEFWEFPQINFFEEYLWITNIPYIYSFRTTASDLWVYCHFIKITQKVIHFEKSRQPSSLNETTKLHHSSELTFLNFVQLGIQSLDHLPGSTSQFAFLSFLDYSTGNSCVIFVQSFFFYYYWNYLMNDFQSVSETYSLLLSSFNKMIKAKNVKSPFISMVNVLMLMENQILLEVLDLIV